jgi:hypothetical protein
MNQPFNITIYDHSLNDKEVQASLESDLILRGGFGANGIVFQSLSCSLSLDTGFDKNFLASLHGNAAVNTNHETRMRLTHIHAPYTISHG